MLPGDFDNKFFTESFTSTVVGKRIRFCAASHQIAIKMCHAIITNCTNCQRSSCQKIKLCDDARGRGIIHITSSAYDGARPNSRSWSIDIDVSNPNDQGSPLKIYTVMEQNHIQTKRCKECDSSIVEYSSCCCKTVLTHCEQCGSMTGQEPLSLCSRSGLIHIRVGVARGDKASVNVCHEFLEGRNGQWALISDVLEVEKRVSGFCWGCSMLGSAVRYYSN